ncbi:MAG: redoxin domain-containing protein [Pyrinomonadaceae bacterium]
MRQILFFTLVLFTFAAAAIHAQGLAVGAAMENFSLPGHDGRPQTLSSLKGQNGTVIVFLSAQCQVVRGYKDRINRVAARGQARGINLIGINSNPNEPLDLIAANATESGYSFPILIDHTQTLMNRLAAKTAPEVFFLNGENVLQYHGAIDNDRSGTGVTQNYLLTAFESSVTQKPILKKSTQPTGCPIRRAVTE